MKFTPEMFADLAHNAEDPEAAEKAAAILNGDLDPETVDAVDRWVRQCFNRPSDDELKMEALNALFDCHGVEALRNERAHWDSYHGDIVATYLNTGDTYAETVLLDRNGKFHLTSYGDWIESR